jgi:TonB family protein
MLATLIAAAAVAATAPTPEIPVNVLAPSGVDPSRFLERPGPGAFASAYPHGAAAMGLSGRAQISCQVLPNGRLDKCKVTEEIPTGVGFGGAALSLARSFRLDPASEAAKRGTIEVPIGFATSKDETEVLVDGPWLEAPTFKDVAAAYPYIGGGVAGVVVLHCGLERDGRLTGCKTLYAVPPDREFDAAALKLSRLFRMQIAPGLLKGHPILGANVMLRLIAPFGDEAKEKRIVDPEWLTRPDASGLSQMFPPIAAAKGVTTGLGYADCTLAADGALVDCRPSGGDPAELGFSEAAAKAASAMRMSPWTDNGGPVDGASVRLPVRFTRAAK